ncbi:PREDICTED: WD repeat-containing protein 88 [Colobus angolensis palliatus]|uniref:WD repeat-containing protein 88 n=1 Tax=Colobus angolensis palliatus TaxID=336983 RepID=UPI0005F41BCF|nr:PREDICTED: WD repeat-containing protein 88 [Colobus angolensis palliatus]
MASPPRYSPTAPDRECKLPPPSARAGEYRPGKLSWGTLARALGCFRLSIPHMRLLATLDPLALDREPPPQLSPEKQQVPEKLIWGDQEPLSKVRTTAGGSGLFPTREEGARAVGGPMENPPGFTRAPRESLGPFPYLWYISGKRPEPTFQCPRVPESPRSGVSSHPLHPHLRFPNTPHITCNPKATAALNRRIPSPLPSCRLSSDAVDGSVVRDFEHRPKAPVVECSITADSSRVIAASYDKTVRAWDLETGKLLWKVRYDAFIVSCKFSPDGKYVVSGFDVDHGICIMDAENITTVSIIKDHHTRSITSCCFDPDSQRVASVSLDRCIKIWDVTSQATLLTITKAHSNAISNCCFTFSGHFLCTSSWDKNLKIWNVHTGEFRNRGACVTLMQGHEGSVSSCHFARDSSFLISGGFDRTVAIWDVAEGYRKLSLKGHNDWVMDVAISNNKKWILSASKDRTMRLWNIEEIDQIPLVIKYKKAMGLKVKQCERCDRPFSIFKSDTSSEMFTQCVFCRIDTRGLPAETSSSSSSDRENSPPLPGGSEDD